VTIENGVSSGAGTGGAIQIIDAAPSILGNVIRLCTATNDGGGIAVLGNLSTSDAEIASNEIVECSAGAEGGGIAVNRASPWVHDNTISNNASGTDGAGIAVRGISSAVRIEDNTISGNTATGSGGGLRIGPDSQGGSTVAGNIVYGNSATNGGGMHFNASDNTAAERNTIAENSSSDQGSGVYFSATTMTLYRTIVSFNAGNSGLYCSGGGPTIRCCVVSRNQGGDLICGGISESNSDADPEFCGTPLSRNYLLQSDSPAAPDQSLCNELIGALPVGCSTSPVSSSTWGRVKSQYR
jgi:parallel beta-helix repeat protein